MKIATWNIKRATKSSKKYAAILNMLKHIHADILILTETSEEIDLRNQYQIFTYLKTNSWFFICGRRKKRQYIFKIPRSKTT